MSALKTFHDNIDSLSTVATAFASNKSRLSDQVLGGAATSVNKWLDHENNRMAKWLGTEQSAAGNLIIRYYLVY